MKNGLVSTLNIEIHQLNQENEGIRYTVEDLTQEIKDLKSWNKKCRLQIN
jgi:cell division protein FtsB